MSRMSVIVQSSCAARITADVYVCVYNAVVFLTKHLYSWQWKLKASSFFLVCVSVGVFRMGGMCPSRALRCVCVLLLMSVCCRAFELQDTIHALIEENIRLHDQLENLTAALRELRQILFHHSSEHEHEHEAEVQHLWKEWRQHGINPETHVLLEQALCGHDLHGSASSPADHISTFITLFFITLLHLML